MWGTCNPPPPKKKKKSVQLTHVIMKSYISTCMLSRHILFSQLYVEPVPFSDFPFHTFGSGGLRVIFLCHRHSVWGIVSGDSASPTGFRGSYWNFGANSLMNLIPPALRAGVCTKCLHNFRPGPSKGVWMVGVPLLADLHIWTIRWPPIIFIASTWCSWLPCKAIYTPSFSWVLIGSLVL